MKEDYISEIRNIVTNKGEGLNQMRFNSIGSIHLIGFSPVELHKGKRLYKKLVYYYREKQLQGENHLNNGGDFAFEKVIFSMNSGKWKKEKVHFFSEIMQDDQTNHINRPQRKRNAIDRLEYGVIKRKIDNRNTETVDKVLVALIDEFDNWFKQYLRLFPDSLKEKYDIQLLLINFLRY